MIDFFGAFEMVVRVKSKGREQHLLDIFCSYDVLRLKHYARRGDAGRIEVRSMEGAVALRFDEVGYFNRVYHVEPRALTKLPELMQVYRNSQHSIELIPSMGMQFTDHAAELNALGFAPNTRYAWLSRDLTASDSGDLSTEDIQVRRPLTTEYDQVLDLYLRGFGAPPESYVSAKANMRLLFDEPRLHFWIVLVDRQPVSLGMLYHVGNCAFLCGGATLPEFRKHGFHRILIRRRFHESRLLGCDSVVSWAVENGQSHDNMCSMGFEMVAGAQSWARSCEQIEK